MRTWNLSVLQPCYAGPPKNPEAEEKGEEMEIEAGRLRPEPGAGASHPFLVPGTRTAQEKSHNNDPWLTHTWTEHVFNFVRARAPLEWSAWYDRLLILRFPSRLLLIQYSWRLANIVGAKEHTRSQKRPKSVWKREAKGQHKLVTKQRKLQ